MLSSTDPVVVVDLSTQPSQDPQPPATTDHPAPAQTSLARHSATPRDQITPIPLPNLTPETPQSAFDNPHSPIPQLSPQQLTAISLLLVGHSAPAAAAILGVHRGTLHRWKTRHPSFVAEYNRRQS